MKELVYFLAAVALTVSTGSTAQDTRSVEPDNAECELPEGWDDVTQRRPLFVVFGEVHGTRQGPEFFGNLACALASRGERVLLAVEHNAIYDRHLQAAWNSSGSQFQSALVENGWAGRRDGVASEAMFSMMVRAHALKERGLAVSIVAFNGVKDEDQARRFADLAGQGPHEASQAENIANAAAAEEFDRVLVLVGNFHARRDSVEVRGNLVEPMARHLARYGNLVSLEMAYGAGNSWNCRLRQDFVLEPAQSVPDDAVECANFAESGNADFNRPPFISVRADLGERSSGEFDGFFWVGSVSGSSPRLQE